MPFNLNDLLHCRSIESNRVEFKATWSRAIKSALVRTACAFANDLLNLNGGYIILGVEESGGHPILPPSGLSNLNMDDLQRDIRSACTRIRPDYQPVLFPAHYESRPILIVWSPGGDNRPYEAPESIGQSGSRFYPYVRMGSETIKAEGDILRQLMETAAKVPFDDRRNLDSRLEDLSPTLVRRFLYDVRSELVVNGHEFDDLELFQKLRVITPINSHYIPKNVGLLFFNETPDSFFRGARTEVVQFGDDAGGNLIEERLFRGPLPAQIKTTLEYLDSLGGMLLQKISGQAEVERTVPYPYEAMEEAIVNAVYHRGYDSPSDPVKVYLYPDRMEITSYPGPVPGIQMDHLESEDAIPAVPARNRRIGELLKELRLAEGRGTGIPKIRRKMRENGSPEARFEFDPSRTYFRVILPVHPRYQALHALRQAAHLWATGEKLKALDHLKRTIKSQPQSGAVVSQLIEYAFATDQAALAQGVLGEFEKQSSTNEPTQPYLTMARLLIDKKQAKEAGKILSRMPKSRTVSETVEAAILKKRSGDFEGAHRLFSEAYSLNPDDSKIVHEFAQTKLKLAKGFWKKKDLSTKKRLNHEAAELLRRAIQLTTDVTREAWCWLDLARTMDWLREPKSEVEGAFLKALSLIPGEPVFEKLYEQWKKKAKQTKTSYEDTGRS